jgi:hypothetical protein
MKREDRAICAGCGQTIEHGVAPDRAGLCERCAESNPPEQRDATAPDDAEDPRRDAAVRRLRESYHEARSFVSREESDPTHRGQLDWILGYDGDDGRAGRPLDGRTSQLVVLWLEDLIRHLEELAPADVIQPAAEPESPTSRRHRAARGLQDATREFADSFRHAADASNAACGS